MNNENFHPTQVEPPLAHALHHWDEATGVLRYEYNGVDILQVTVPPYTPLGFRHGSDGSMQSGQYMQQIYLASEIPCEAVVTLRVHAGALNMRPKRAGAEQAILGTQPEELAFGVNGIYDTLWDLLIDWHGEQWNWTQAKMSRDTDGFLTASFVTQLSLRAMFINVRPWYYAKHLGYEYHRPWLHRPQQKVIAGWCSWEAYRRDISSEKIERIADFLQENLKAYGLEYLQVDDGYQAMPLPVEGNMDMPQGWMTCDGEKFPKGHTGIVESIEQRGLEPAIWVNANITNPDFVAHHPQCVVWNGGEALKGEWIDYLYNCDAQTLKTQVEPLFAALQKRGYRYIKIDAIRHLLFDGLHECVRLGLMTNDEAKCRFRSFMEASKRGMGDDVYYLASWGEMHEVVGVADACRISMDANPTWAGVRMQLFESARWFHTHRILFANDPDHVCVRTKAEWAKSILSLISLSGELYMLSDTPEAYTKEKLEILQKTLPPIAVSAGETGPLSLEYPAYTWTKLHGFAVQSHETPVEMEDVSAEEAANIAGCIPDADALHPFSTLWSFAMAHHGLQWRIMLRVATVPLLASTVPLAQLALDPNKVYLAYDFWEQTYLGKIIQHINCPALSLGCCQAVAFYEVPNIPQLIASDRHISMDAVSVRAHCYNSNKQQLTLTLQGIEHTTYHYTIYVPENMNLKDVKIDGGRASATTKEELLLLEIDFDATEVAVCLTF